MEPTRNTAVSLATADLRHLPLLLVLLLAVGLAASMLLLSHTLGPKRPGAVKNAPFECGNPASGPSLDRFHVKFYLVAILFLAFDIEAVFIYPWAILFGEGVRGEVPAQMAPLGVLAAAMVSFVAVVLVGLTYAWRKGALSWSQESNT